TTRAPVSDAGAQARGTAGPVVPDVVSLAKALANGLPIGAIVAHGDAATAFGPGDHASTFGGNPVACAAALAVLDTIAADDLVTRAADTGRLLAARLAGLADGRPLVAGVRGRGLLQALVLTRPVAADATAAALAEGLVVNAVAPDAVRLAPPLIIGQAEVDLATARLGAALDAIAADQGDAT